MNRLNKLNSVHGINTSIHNFNSYYNLDCLRIDNETFNRLLASITVSDILRIAALADKNIVEFALVA